MLLYCDHNEVVTFDSLESTILGHQAANIKYYEWFHTGNMLKDAERYLKFEAIVTMYSMFLLLFLQQKNLSLTVYQKVPKGNIHILEQTTHATGKEFHLKFTQQCN